MHNRLIFNIRARGALSLNPAGERYRCATALEPNSPFLEGGILLFWLYPPSQEPRSTYLQNNEITLLVLAIPCPCERFWSDALWIYGQCAALMAFWGAQLHNAFVWVCMLHPCSCAGRMTEQIRFRFVVNPNIARALCCDRATTMVLPWISLKTALFVGTSVSKNQIVN